MSLFPGVIRPLDVGNVQELNGDASAGSVLHQFWEACDRVAAIPEHLVCDLLLHPSW